MVGLKVGKHSAPQMGWGMRFAQVKEEPAQRAGDTEQNAYPNPPPPKGP